MKLLEGFHHKEERLTDSFAKIKFIIEERKYWNESFNFFLIFIIVFKGTSLKFEHWFKDIVCFYNFLLNSWVSLFRFFTFNICQISQNSFVQGLLNSLLTILWSLIWISLRVCFNRNCTSLRLVFLLKVNWFHPV